MHHIEEYDTSPFTLRDRAVSRRVKEAFRDHRRLHGLPVKTAVRGGVVHVTGTVAREDRRLIRTVLSGIRGAHAVWDFLTVPGEEEPRVIDLGCGRQKQVPWAIGVDHCPYGGVDIVADLETRLPFDDGEIDIVFASHILEHVRDLLGLMNEIHRVLKPHGVLHVLVPNCRSVNALANPTHVRFFNTQTFKFFCRGYPGLKPFHPGCISEDRDTIFADLYPVQEGEPLPDDEELAQYFD